MEIRMFDKSKPAQANVLSHWYTPVPNFNMSTQEFYNKVEAELKAQQVPGLEVSRVEFLEGGLFSAKRQYLRLTRERLTFDVCAAGFGVNFFFSCRFAELPLKIKFSGVLLLFILCALFLGTMSYTLGTVGIVISVLPLLVGVYILKNALNFGLESLDKALIKHPTFGPLYEYFVRKETYYRQDTRLMYMTVVEGIVKKLVEEETATKGVKLLSQYEYAPILGEQYKPTTKQLNMPQL
jgi:uncharacterized membrane protein YbaN (DUF454 family)